MAGGVVAARREPANDMTPGQVLALPPFSGTFTGFYPESVDDLLSALGDAGNQHTARGFVLLKG